ncbi:hypothetical protein HCUR_00345 [Holospora curviuscula]|uniref:Uncharacterized protein n=1 Tax=Holospora curviuscula TaxID=1082868 RepID=A0A2S5RDA7_9PROT|nr:hypothetical protein HCUR_00345 [Holospora curviuscula]
MHRAVHKVHPLALASLDFLENLAVSGHRNFLKSILPQGGAQKELLPSLNARGIKHRTGARILLLVYPKGKAHPKEFSHHGHGVLGILAVKK